MQSNSIEDITMESSEVFTPNTVPTYTYYDRSGTGLEKDLKNALNVAGAIVAISGPSKCGKSVLCESVIGHTGMARVSGSGVTEEDQFWNRLRSVLHLPSGVIESGSQERMSGREAGAELGIASVLKGGVKGSKGRKISRGESRQFGSPDGIDLLRTVSERDLVLVLDDFHYVHGGVQKLLVEQFKEAASSRCRIVLLSIPHRGDDAINANPDLMGRVYSIDIPKWREEELKHIAVQGFDQLNVNLPSSTLDSLAAESLSSPQLMQRLCLQLCTEQGIERPCTQSRYVELSDIAFDDMCRAASSWYKCSSVVERLLSGSRTRGTRRNVYPLKDGKDGDVYYCILRAISGGSPMLSLSINEIKRRIDGYVLDDLSRETRLKVVGIESALRQMDVIASSEMEGNKVLEWDDARKMLSVLDPHFLFYLRWHQWK